MTVGTPELGAAAPRANSAARRLRRRHLLEAAQRKTRIDPCLSAGVALPTASAATTTATTRVVVRGVEFVCHTNFWSSSLGGRSDIGNRTGAFVDIFLAHPTKGEVGDKGRP